MQSRERLCAVVIVSAVFAAGATMADAKRLPQAHSATFRAQLSGTQFSQTNLFNRDNPSCAFPSGTSTERIEFQSTTFTLQVTELPPSEIELGRTGVVKIPVNGTVTRSNMGSATCFDDPSKPEDCGVVPIRQWSLIMQWRVRGFQLVGGSPIDRDPFLNCSGNPLLDPFPNLSGALDKEKPVEAHASIAAMIDRRDSPIVAKANGTQTFRDSDGDSTVNLAWTMTLVRKASKKRRH